MFVGNGQICVVERVADSGQRLGRTPTAPVRSLRLLDGRDVEDELDLVGHQHVATAESLVELHAVVAPAELPGYFESDSVAAIRIRFDSVHLGGQGQLIGDAPQREVAGDP